MQDGLLHVVGASIASAAAIYFAARSVQRRSTVDLAALGVPLPDGVELLTPRQIDEEAIDVLAQSWSGSDQTSPELGFDWMLGPALRGKYKDKTRLRILAWIMRFFVGLGAGSGGVMLGMRDATTGALVGAVYVNPYLRGLPGSLGELQQLIVALCRVAPRHGLTGFTAKGFGQRFRASYPTVDDGHKKAVANQRPHLHVGPVGVLPAYQGHGRTSTMMRHVNKWADKLGVACYLECSGNNKPIYERFGYRDVGGPDREIGPNTIGVFDGAGCNIDPDGQPPFDDFWNMVRPEPS